MTDQAVVLVLASIGRDAQIASSILSGANIGARPCANLAEAVDGLGDAHCLVVAEEALVNADRSALAHWIESQPAWSDFPIVLLVMRGTEYDKRLSFLDRYLIILERPFLASSLVNSVRAGIRARRRQLEVKSYIERMGEIADRQRLLIRELHHRVKNTLANVRAMMAATARSSDSMEDFVRDFSARIVSLADTHSLLTDDYWQMASLRQLLEGELRHYETHEFPRISLDGPDIALVADLAIPVSMAFHELASNSSKFGALSRPTGRLDVSWRVDEASGNRAVMLYWRERNGPRVEAPRRQGFGTMLLEKVVPLQCDAMVEIDYQPAGLQFTMQLPLRNTRLVPNYA